MMLEGNQRGGAYQMARHLMNTQDNEHVEVHEISGFISDTVFGALEEIYATSKGTKCKQFMFSVSLNPPQNETVPIEYFENALARIEDKTGLSGQSRVVVFHEKEGRRHAHCIWSRIDADEMKAINLPHYKRKLNEISKDLFLEHGWDLPQGFIDRAMRNPLNLSRDEWQQAKRNKQDPLLLKAVFQRAWQISDNKHAFENALKEHGLWLAQGDRRGFVAVDYNSKPYSLSKWAGVKTRALKQKLGDPEELPTVQETQNHIAQKMTQVLKEHIKSIEEKFKNDFAPFKFAIQKLKRDHTRERKELDEQHKDRWLLEEQKRMNRLPHGLMGLWQRITGKYYKIRRMNEEETIRFKRRDQKEKQTLINKQLRKRQRLQIHIQKLRDKHNHIVFDLRKDIGHYTNMRNLEDFKFRAETEHMHSQMRHL